jgi:N-acetylglucosaminyldiphosphoundecaprenol N-acetyl-beta-D-mannosaminyltransferase
MSHWLHEQQLRVGSTAYRSRVRSDRLLRVWDVCSAGLLLVLLLLPLAVARCFGRLEAVRQPGESAGSVQRHRLVFDTGLAGRVLAAIGAGAWPVLLDVLAGRMSWVGPRSLLNLPASAAGHGLRPGVVSLWGLRQRTAVDFVSEVDCDYEYLSLRGVRHDLGLLLRAVLVSPLRNSRAQAGEGRVLIGDVAFDNVDMAQALQRVDALLAGTRTAQVSFVNPACVNIAAHDRGYRRALARADLVLPDGIGIKIGADILGTPLRQNVNGTDLFPRLCGLLQDRGAALFLLGGQPGVPEAVAERIRVQWPGLRVVGWQHGFFAPAEEGDVVRRIHASGADLVLVARGVPMQDIFIDRYLPQFGSRVVMGVGGLFDFVAGRINRAPGWMRDSGLEWIYRLMQEPGRMWRRYLLGNFTFLARVSLQRLGWRHAATDLPTQAKASTPEPGAQTRAVLFACQGAHESLPVDADLPSALWPLGCASFLERALESLAESGIQDVHLVASHQPEALRRVAGAGERWGLKIRWHLARDAGRPYDVLRTLDWTGVERVLVGRAETWIGSGVVRTLAEQGGVAWIDTPQFDHWTGWAASSPAALRAWPTQGDTQDIAQQLLRGPEPALICPRSQTALAGSAADMLAAQAALRDPAQAQARQLPGAWIRTPWGGMSPSARVHPGARITGPVLLGPGCLVDDGAQVGPDVVLERDVVVARGSSVVDAVVLPNTFIGQGLSVRTALVNGNRLHPLELGITIQMPASDGLLAPLRATRPAQHIGALARGLAMLALAVLWLPGRLDAAGRRARGQAPRWQRVQVVTGLDEAQSEALLQPLHVLVTAPGPCGPASWLDAVGPLRDVAAGRRAWLGRRPMDAQRWGAVSDEWQALLARLPVGVFHAATWRGNAATPDAAQPAGDTFEEAELAADVFLAVQSDAASRHQCLWAALPGLRTRSPARPVSVTPPPVWRPAVQHTGVASAGAADVPPSMRSLP